MRTACGQPSPSKSSLQLEEVVAMDRDRLTDLRPKPWPPPLTPWVLVRPRPRGRPTLGDRTARACPPSADARPHPAREPADGAVRLPPAPGRRPSTDQ